MNIASYIEHTNLSPVLTIGDIDNLVADEIDVVWNVTAFKTGIPWTKIEVAKCTKLAHDQQKLLKVIIETAYLSDSEIEQLALIRCNDHTVNKR